MATTTGQIMLARMKEIQASIVRVNEFSASSTEEEREREEPLVLEVLDSIRKEVDSWQRMAAALSPSHRANQGAMPDAVKELFQLLAEQEEVIRRVPELGEKAAGKIEELKARAASAEAEAEKARQRLEQEQQHRQQLEAELAQVKAAAQAEPDQPGEVLAFPYRTRELDALHAVAVRFWADYTPDKRRPKQIEVQMALCGLLDLPIKNDPPRKAVELASAIRPDDLPDT